MSLVEIAFLTLFHACKKFAGLKIISENNFRGLRCNEVPGICRTNSLSKQGFDKGKHQNVFPHSTFIITLVAETAERRFKRNTFRNFQAKGLKATHDCNNVGL